MLNELVTLQRSLAERHIDIGSSHPSVKPFKKGPAVVASLNEDGRVESVSFLTAETVSTLRNIAPDNQKAFPGFNLNCPLLAIENSAEMWLEADGVWNRTIDAASAGRLGYDTKAIARLKRLLVDFPVQEVLPNLGGDDPVLKSTVALLKRLASPEFDPSTFVKDLSEQIVRAVQNGGMAKDLAIAILAGKPDKKKKSLESSQVTLILDVSDLQHFPYRVADPAVGARLSHALLAADDSSQGPSSVCGLTGRVDMLETEKMPEPTLKIIGKTYLMSMNKAIPCQTRYGRTAMDIFPVGKKAAREVNDALQFITGESRRDQTWSSVPNPTNTQPDLIVSYVEGSAEPVVGIFADLEPNPDRELATYEERTALVHKSLKLLVESGEDRSVAVIVIGKIDPGRAQVLFSAYYSVQSIFAGRDAWFAGARNIPEFSLPFPSGKGKPPAWHSPRVPSPSEVAVSFRKQWLQAGQKAQGVPGVEMGRVYSVMLDADATDQAGWLLDRYVRLTQPLLTGIARSLSGGERLAESAMREALAVIPIFGILLHRQGRLKEIYMNSRDYLLGQFLQMADLLHKLYCKHERGGSIPPQLIGNATIPMALQSPRRALTVLCARMPVYIAWANRYEGENAGLAKWTRKQLGVLSTALKDESLDSQVTPNGKAELLLGYLATGKENE